MPQAATKTSGLIGELARDPIPFRVRQIEAELERARKTITDSEEQAIIRTGLAMARAILGDFEQALHHHRAARTLSANAFHIANNAVTMEKLKRHAEALDLWTEALDAPNGYRSFNLASTAVCLRNLGMHDEAEALYQESLKQLQPPTEEESLIAVSTAAGALGHDDDGIELAARWVALASNKKLGQQSPVEFLSAAHAEGFPWVSFMSRRSPSIVRAWEFRRLVAGALNHLPRVQSGAGPRDVSAEEEVEREALEATASWRGLANIEDSGSAVDSDPGAGND